MFEHQHAPTAPGKLARDRRPARAAADDDRVVGWSECFGHEEKGKGKGLGDFTVGKATGRIAEGKVRNGKDEKC
ncbi:hypothetical protein GCM10008020_28180 [Massilia psychrophila]|nr:hypothetical protein GCM10008020_28180 [Massilia psychrophila]